MIPVVYEAPVDLSQYHAGQMIEHSASMRASGHMVRRGHDAFAKPIYTWVADRWQATHVVLDRSDGTRANYVSPWYTSRDAAEAWLEARGLYLGGAYWHAASEVAS